MNKFLLGLIIVIQGVSIYLDLSNNYRLKQVTEMACQIGNKTEAFGCFPESSVKRESSSPSRNN